MSATELRPEPSEFSPYDVEHWGPIREVKPKGVTGGFTKQPVLRVRKNPPSTPTPIYKTSGSAAFDVTFQGLREYDSTRVQLLRQPAEDGSGSKLSAIIIEPGGRAKLGTGLFIETPPGWYLSMTIRSGVGWTYAGGGGLLLCNGEGVIDNDYRGEIMAAVFNHGHEPFALDIGDRFAQVKVLPMMQAAFEIVETLADTGRGTGGFGSTGVK